MRRILLIIAVLIMADGVAQTQRLRIKSDSIKFAQVLQIIDADTSMISITKKECLILFLTGYLNGAISLNQKGRFDYDGLLRDIKANKRSIDQQGRLIKGIK